MFRKITSHYNFVLAPVWLPHGRHQDEPGCSRLAAFSGSPTQVTANPAEGNNVLLDEVTKKGGTNPEGKISPIPGLNKKRDWTILEKTQLDNEDISDILGLKMTLLQKEAN